MTSYTLKDFDLLSQLSEVRRELQMRRSFYPKWVGAGKMTLDEADKRIAAMEAVLETLTQLHRAKPDEDKRQLSLLE